MNSKSKTYKTHDLSQYSIGISSIDSEHARIAELLFQFRDAGPEMSVADREELLRTLSNYAEEHLASEGAMMVYYHYPHEESHTIENLKLVRGIYALTPESSLKEITFVISEFLHHTDTYDRMFAHFVIHNRSRRETDQYHDTIL